MDAATAIRIQLGDLFIQVAALSEQKEKAEAEIARLNELVPTEKNDGPPYPLDA